MGWPRPAKTLGGPSVRLTGRKRGRFALDGYRGLAQPSPRIGQCLNGGYDWLEIECCWCKTRASLPLDARGFPFCGCVPAGLRA
jgi:hypothetical protein